MPLTLYYFPLRGRVEVFKLMCAAKNIEYEIKDVDYGEMKSDRVKYPFGQCPRLVDGDVDICQSNAMIRHVARKYGMYGSGDAEAAAVDQIIDGVESIRGVYLKLIYVEELKDDAKAAYKVTHIDAESSTARNSGAHFAYLEGLLARNGGGSGYVIGSGLTAADLCVWEIVDLHLRIFKQEMEAGYPLLVAHHGRVAGLPGIKEYLASPARLDKVNNNNLG
ncbi:glutathione S-transferase [Scenedesmus sp. NREL 46B-D3]|nr:glutathione S-transferase [Scenedesmus sp. NREL 46B-D3]